MILVQSYRGLRLFLVDDFSSEFCQWLGGLQLSYFLWLWFTCLYKWKSPPKAESSSETIQVIHRLKLWTWFIEMWRVFTEDALKPPIGLADLKSAIHRFKWFWNWPDFWRALAFICLFCLLSRKSRKSRLAFCDSKFRFPNNQMIFHFEFWPKSFRLKLIAIPINVCRSQWFRVWRETLLQSW